MRAKKQNVNTLELGMTVEINPRSDSSRKVLVQGVILKILTKSDSHPHGILVELETGEIGRVKRVIAVQRLTKSNDPQPTSTLKIQLSTFIDQGENHRIEFKSDILWSTNFTKEDIKNHRPQSKELHAYGKATSKIVIAKSLASFLNSDGGTLIIGVRENKENCVDEIIGVELEFQSLRDASQDGYRRMIVDLIKDYFPSNIFNHLNSYFRIEFEKINDLLVCGIVVAKSDKKVFLKLNNIDHFFIRADASTREISGEQIVDYCQSRFANMNSPIF